MKLTQVRIFGFRSAKEKVVLHIDGRTTVLIGANDNGKTNLLSAVECLNDDKPIAEGDRNWDLSAGEQPSIEWQFNLAPEERLALLDVLKNCLSSVGTVRVNPDSFSLSLIRRPKEIDNETSLVGTVAAVTEAILAMKEDMAKKLSIAATVTFRRSGVSGPLIVIGQEPFEMPELAAELLARRPRIELFKSTDQLMDVVTVTDLENPTQEFMQGIFRYADLWEARGDLFQQTPATTRDLERASEVFTDKIRSEWQQGEDLTFRLNHAGQNGSHIELLIEDPAVAKRFVRPSERSEGFSTFFRMSMRMLARTAANPGWKRIFLFDEPGTSLHPSGQVNLQRVFERLAADNQILYSTHSLFMINHNRPQRNRVIAKGARGTTIDQKPFLRNWRAVRQSLGLILAGTFFIADRTLLVEGESDALYIGALFAAFDQAGKIDVDLNLFSVQWAGNARDFEPMARLMLDEGREVVAVVDGDKGGKDLIKRVEKLNALIAKGETHLNRPIEVVELARNQSIEDLLPQREKYFDAILDTAQELIGGGFRKTADWAISRDQMRDQLNADYEGITLGKHVDRVTKKWFAKEESISKLAVARHYCAWLDDNALPAKAAVPESLLRIEKALNLETKASEKEVFEAARTTPQAPTVP